MTPVEALATLGFAPTDTPNSEEVRRAYLRTLKRFNPEVDPNGFARVRAAFEVARNSAYQVTSEAQPFFGIEQASAEPVQASPATVAPLQPDPLEPYRAQLAALPNLPREPKLEIARKAVDEHPDDPEARQLLLDEYESDSATDQIKEVLLEGIRLGQTAFLSQALWAYPQIVPVDELHRIVADQDATPVDLALIARAFAANNIPETAIETVERIAKGLDETGFHWLHLAVEALLWLHIRDQPFFAQRGLTAIRRFLATTAPAPGQIAHETAVLISLLQEFESVPNLPTELRLGLAREGLEGNFRATINDTHQFTQNHGKLQAYKWRRLLKKEAPLISRLLVWAPWDAKDLSADPQDPLTYVWSGIPLLIVLFLTVLAGAALYAHFRGPVTRS